MKLICLLLFFSGSVCIAATTYAQSTKLSLDLSNKTLMEAMDVIEKQSEFRFYYNSKLINTKQKVSLKFDNEDVYTILSELFNSTRINYKINGKDIILTVETETSDRSGKYPASDQDSDRKTVTGTVTDSNNEPLIGVTIQVKNSDQATITDFMGAYRLEKVSSDAILVFSFIGMKTQEIALSGKTVLNVHMVDDLMVLNEVVVIGYGTQKKSDVTGAVSTVGSKDINNMPASNVQQALIGKVAGAFITPSQGADPTGGIGIQIRGTNSLNDAANNPLYVVDGIPMFGDNVSISIDPENIESITVLKDASSTAIYGVRAAAGVILVTTKNGKKGESKVTFSADFGIQQPYKYYDVINSEQFYDLMERSWDQWEFFTGGDRTTKTSYTDFYKPAIWDAENNRPLHDVNWQKSLLNDNAKWQKYSVGISGGSEKMDYYFNLSYEKREGIFMNTFFDRLSVSGKVNYQVRSNIKTGFTTNIAYSERAGSNGLNDKYGSYMPTVYKPTVIPMYHPGTNEHVYASHEWKVDPGYNIAPYRQAGFISNNSVYDFETRSDKIDNLSTLINFYFEYKPVEGLTLTTNASADFGNGESKNIQYLRPAMHLDLNNPSGMDNVSTRVWFGKRKSLMVNEIINYRKTFAGKHDVDLTGVFEVQDTFSDQLEVTANGSTDNDLDQISNQPKVDVFSPNGNLVNPRNFSGSPYNRDRFASFMGRLSYNYDRRYYATATVRTDGSSKFISDNRWGTFGALALSWHLHNEAFFKKWNIDKYITQIKPRISYGTTGNQSSVGHFLYLSNVNSGSGVYGNISYPINIPNPSIGWETLKQLNVGLDVSLFSGRLNIMIEYYNKKNSDMLGDLPLPISSGYANYKGNLGRIQNTGWDITLNSYNISKKNFSWTTDFTFSLNKNEILDLGTDQDGSKIDNVIVGKFIRKVGQPVSCFYLYSYDGVWQLGDEDKITAGNGPVGHNQVGLFRVLDRQAAGEDGHGIINDDDRAINGSPLPDFFGGFTNNFRYKNWNLGIICSYSVGNKLFNQTKSFLQTGHRFQQSDKEFYNNHWSPENPTNKYQKLSSFESNNTYQQNIAISHQVDHWLEDASYLRINNINLNYTLPARISNSFGCSQLVLGAQVSNVWTFTPYSGLDPAADKGFGAGNPSIRGVDEGGYPQARTYLFNVKMTF